MRTTPQECAVGASVNAPQAQRPPHPAAQVLECLAECERTQISHSFALLKQVRWWEGPVLGWDYEYRRLSARTAECAVSFLFV